MQKKVSMVMPCYNKEDYIGEMFDSIINQDWDNIELILVNDGSTDGTRDVIAKYEAKFAERGYSVVVIDQKNAGVCAAAKAGLLKITGQYMCMVDADDELNPKYVSSMARWLDENLEYDYCMCGNRYYTGFGPNKTYGESWFPQIRGNRLTVKDYLLGNAWWSIWAYMVRADYFFKCNIIETYITDTRGSHEPGFMVPLTANGGLCKIIPLPLYYHNRGVAGAHSQHKALEKMKAHMNEYFRLVRKAVELLPENVADTLKKQDYIKVSEFAHLRQMYVWGRENSETVHVDECFNAILDFANEYFNIEQSLVWNKQWWVEAGFVEVIKNALTAKVIGYGAMGKMAARLMPLIRKTAIEPTELWDINGDGINIKIPDFDNLEERDTVLVFPIGDIEKELHISLSELPCKVLYAEDIMNYRIDLFKRRLENER